MAERDFYVVVLAALLHDVGKLLQRGRSLAFDIQGRHPEVSARFVEAFQSSFIDYVDPSLLRTLVLHHHRTIPGLRPEDIPDPRQRLLALLINKADGLSASERGERGPGWQDFKTTPLAPVFQRVTLGKQQGEPATRYHPAPLRPPPKMSYSLFPDTFAEYAAGELEELLVQFGSTSHPILERAHFASFDSLVLYLLDLLEAYAWAVPSDTQVEVPDVSLFDHLKSTAAIAGSLYRFLDVNGALTEESLKETGREAFLLAVGDVSGIQSYIFDIATGDEIGGGVARRLRARSLFIQLLSEVVSHDILWRLSLPPTHLLMASGGKFYLLLPNVAETLTTLEERRKQADRWCMEVLRAEVAVNLSWVPFGEEQLQAAAKGQRSFGAVVERAMAHLAVRKEQRLYSGLTTGEIWDEERLIFPGFEGEAACRSCGKFPRPEDGDLCARCALDLMWGARLPRARYVAILPGGRGEVEILGYGVSLYERSADVPTDASLVLAINEPGVGPVGGAPTTSKYLVSRVPTRDRDGRREVLTWGELAERSEGRSYLGFLKADADRLGQVFAKGLSGWDTMSRLATLSREVDLFFSGWVQHLLTEPEFGYCYPVFCGGDDLLVVGPWNAIVNFASRIQEDYRRFTAHNSDMTLSAAVIIAQSHYPISQAAKDVEHALEEAKESGRDRVSILGSTLTWHDWGQVSAEWQALRTMVKEEQAPSGLLYRLLEYGRMWDAYRKGCDPLGLRAQPLLAYAAARTLDSRRQPRLCHWVEQLVAVKPLDERHGFLLDHLELLAQLLILGRRGEGG